MNSLSVSFLIQVVSLLKIRSFALQSPFYRRITRGLNTKSPYRVVARNTTRRWNLLLCHGYIAPPTMSFPSQIYSNRCRRNVSKSLRMTNRESALQGQDHVHVSFSHIHLFVDQLEDLSVYKDLERRLNQFDSLFHYSEQKDQKTNIEQGQSLWQTLCKNVTQDEQNQRNGYDRMDRSSASRERSISVSSTFDDETNNANFVSQNRDVVKQLIAGLGFRITGVNYPTSTTSGSLETTRSVLVTSKDPDGVQIVVTALDRTSSRINNSDADTMRHPFKHFHASEVQRFFKHNSRRQGIATLAFEVMDGDIELLYLKYRNLHPILIGEDYANGVLSYFDHGQETAESSNESCNNLCTKLFEVYAYYKSEKVDRIADKSTKLRFIQQCPLSSSNGNSLEPIVATRKTDSNMPRCILPGLQSMSATFDSTCVTAYFDHWVSNVFSRTGFIDTMKDVLGFLPKVDFNAGVVAAGEAQIESTVIGNDSSFRTYVKTDALVDKSQVYLPINNALSEVGHVHGFLQEIGQGIQHIASRVDDLAAFVQRGNDFRKMTGEGFTFLRIPRSYYGVLDRALLLGTSTTEKDQPLSLECAEAIIEACIATGIMTPEGAVGVYLNADDVMKRLDSALSGNHLMEYNNRKEFVVTTVLRSRYTNLYKLLGDNVGEQMYLSLVRNQILVDVQGQDLLFQIFTSSILQREIGQEAPFFEYIQRVCSDRLHENGRKLPIAPGCGGFGIRNFLTLFLSIEVSKAMLQVFRCKKTGDIQGQKYSQKMVDIFTEQLNESNPILNEISEAMKEEGVLLNDLKLARLTSDENAVLLCQTRLNAASAAKMEGNRKLMACSAKYKYLMKSLRLEGAGVQC